MSVSFLYCLKIELLKFHLRLAFLFFGGTYFSRGFLGSLTQLAVK